MFKKLASSVVSSYLTQNLTKNAPKVNQSALRTFFSSPTTYVKVQQAAPEFEGKAIVNGEIKDIKLSDFAGKYVVLFFYPLDFTFVCPTELISFSDHIEEFNKIDVHVIGCSCDSHFSHLAFINTPKKLGGLGGLKYPLLSDFNKEIAKAYDVLIEPDGIPLRGLFIIDPKGCIRQITINDLPVGRSVDEVIRLVQAFQFVDKNGEVCPMNWKPNSPTIKPDPNQAKEYFDKVNK
ncbi:peroxiredoxin-like [Adelges cooleyi]|uniref:peroxiredoxin-like n=1 Tax=Adelges cooleyi TaxID=133065 RepID=UPI00217F7CF0|nr:peroxiredoxin-like [Adelges cooleyi]